jgi:hypothetical protein
MGIHIPPDQKLIGAGYPMGAAPIGAEYPIGAAIMGSIVGVAKDVGVV